jgi:hypothetical protein
MEGVQDTDRPEDPYCRYLRRLERARRILAGQPGPRFFKHDAPKRS